MDRKFLKKFLSQAGWRISDAQFFMELAGNPSQAQPHLPERTLIGLVRQAAQALRGENSESSTWSHDANIFNAFSWENPWVELQYPVEWDWSQPDAQLGSPFQLPQAPSEGKLDWLIKAARQQHELLIFEVLTHGAAIRKKGGERSYLINPHHTALLDEAIQSLGKSQQQSGVDEYFELLFTPFTVGFMSDFDGEKKEHIGRKLESVPPVLLRCTDEQGSAVDGVFVVQVHPLLVDEDEKRAYYPVIAGLSLWPHNQRPDDVAQLVWKSPPALVASWSSTQKQCLWDELKRQIEEIEKRCVHTPAESEGQSIALPQPDIVAASPQRRYLLEGNTRVDRQAATLVAYATGLNLPRKWGAIRTWDSLVEDEIGRLQSSEKSLKNSLVQKTRPNGDKVLELSDEAANALMVREGHKGFRRIVRDDDGVSREYLIKRLKASGGSVEMRLSWYGQAWPFIEEAVEKNHNSLKGLEARSDFGQKSLFEELQQRQQEELDGRLRFMEAIRDARLVMDMILRSFGRDGENPLHIPAWQLRSLLECEKESDGFRRINGCLRALQEIRFHIQAGARGLGPAPRVFGSFLSDVKYVPRGAGRHTDGDYYLHISPSAIGCLQVFATAQYKIKNAERVLAYDWQKELSKEDKVTLDSGYAKGFLTLAPFYDKVKGFSTTQGNLLRWIERELTLNKDAVRRGHQAQRAVQGMPSAEEPRLYGRDFCPLLPAGLHFFGALGHFSRNPESGRRLLSSRTARASDNANEGLMAIMGHVLPPERAQTTRSAVIRQTLGDLRAVVEEALGGYAAVWLPEDRSQRRAGTNGKWLSLEQAAELPEKTLLNIASWHLFVAPDFRTKLADDLEKYHADRFARGETPYEIKVTADRQTADKGHLEAQGEHFVEETGSQSLRTRLRAHRQEKRLSQAKVGALFGVSQKTIDYWEKGPQPDAEGIVRGKPIPREIVPMLTRWIEQNIAPSSDELGARSTRRSGVRRVESG